VNFISQHEIVDVIFDEFFATLNNTDIYYNRKIGNIYNKHNLIGVLKEKIGEFYNSYYQKNSANYSKIKDIIKDVNHFESKDILIRLTTGMYPNKTLVYNKYFSDFTQNMIGEDSLNFVIKDIDKFNLDIFWVADEYFVILKKIIRTSLEKRRWSKKPTVQNLRKMVKIRLKYLELVNRRCRYDGVLRQAVNDFFGDMLTVENNLNCYLTFICQNIEKPIEEAIELVCSCLKPSIIAKEYQDITCHYMTTNLKEPPNYKLVIEKLNKYFDDNHSDKYFNKTINLINEMNTIRNCNGIKMMVLNKGYLSEKRDIMVKIDTIENPKGEKIEICLNKGSAVIELVMGEVVYEKTVSTAQMLILSMFEYDTIVKTTDIINDYKGITTPMIKCITDSLSSIVEYKSKTEIILKDDYDGRDINKEDFSPLWEKKAKTNCNNSHVAKLVRLFKKEREMTFSQLRKQMSDCNILNNHIEYLIQLEYIERCEKNRGLLKYIP
jgi:hypothetical protein